MNDININELICSPGAERVILANCINDNNNIIECDSEGLLPKHFAIEANKIIYSAIMYLYTKNANIDPVSIVNVIRDEKASKVLNDIGGLEYLMLLQQSPISQNIKLFCQEIISCYNRRNVYRTCKELQEYVIDSKEKDTDNILGYVSQRITDLTLESNKVTEVYKMGDKLEERLKNASTNPNAVPGLSTGWNKFDKATKGGEEGDLIVVCAEAKTGKSVTLLNWAKHISIDNQLPILWIDSEQTAQEQESRLLSIVSGIPEDEIKTGLFTEDTAYGLAKDKTQKLKIAQYSLKRSQFFHIYMPDFTLDKIVALSRKFHLKYGIVALFFDYINFNPLMMSQNKGLRDDIMLTNLAIGLKNIGGDLKIPVFTAAQENRGGYGNSEKDAKNIGGSIGILQKATKLCFLRNLSDEELITSKVRANQEFLIKYQRHGETDIKIPILYKKNILTQIEV